jgi:malate dehydrogenase (oxaloacetate-decarboxylating)(NADP+)
MLLGSLTTLYCANSFTSIVIQYEDWKNPFPALERYQHTFSMFNDDVQGTGAVIVGGFVNAVKASGVAAKDHRAVFLGAGSAGVGVAKQIVQYFIKEGLTEEEAKKKFWLVDSRVRLFQDILSYLLTVFPGSRHK